MIFGVSKAVVVTGVLLQPLSMWLSLIQLPEGLVLVVSGEALLAAVPESPLQSRTALGRTGGLWHCGAGSWLLPSPAL